MPRLIDADALKNIHGMRDDCAECDKELRHKSRSCEFDRVYTLMDFCGWIDDAPTIEPERKTGTWLPDNRPGGGFWVCSCCKFPSEAFAADKLYKYCPVCGAYMEDDEDGDMPD